MANIAVDVDDTLYSFSVLARTKLVEMYKETGDKDYKEASYGPWMEWRSPPGILGVDKWLKVIDRCHTEEEILKQSPFPYCKDVLRRLEEAGHELVYVSTRNPEAFFATATWLRENDFPEGHLTCAYGDKTEATRDCKYMIDDRPKNLLQFVYDYHWTHRHGVLNVEHQRIGFALKTEYNFQLTDAPNIYLAPDWNMLQYYLEKKGLIDAVANESIVRLS